MRILHVIQNLSGGGAERQLSYLAPELSRTGHKVHIAYLEKGPHKPDLPGVVLHYLKVRSNYDPYLFWQLMQLIRRTNLDIVHTWILQMDILGGIAARLNGIPWVFREPSSARAYPSQWKNRLRVIVGSGASAIISNSSGGDEYWKTKQPAIKRYIVSNGLPKKEIGKVDAAFPTGLVEPGKPFILYVGRLTSDSSATKNLNVFFEAFARVRRQRAVVGILCGEGPQRFELEALRDKLGLNKDVYFTGHLPAASVWALMKQASAFVSLSLFEGCPNSVMEAMACGCPLVLSDIPAHREILSESGAIFVDPSSAKQTADAIAETLRNVKASKNRALLAHQKTQEWSITKMTRKYEMIYRECI